jgi:GcrA cell cycle regulator
MSAVSFWTPDRVQTLIRLWRDGLSASQIARALAGGVTRSAVIGKIHRLGLGGRARPSSPPARPRLEVRPRPKLPRAPAMRPPRTVAVEPASPPPEIGSATVLTIRRGQCRWPIGEPLADSFSLCGCAAVRGAYCSGHAQIAYRPLATKPPRDHLVRLAGLA